MSAFNKIKAWRGVLELAMAESGIKRASGRQREGYESYLPSVALKMSRLTECSVYGGRRIPLPPVYLTVECAIKSLGFDSEAEREAFRLFVFNRLRTSRSLDSAAVGIHQRELGLKLIETLERKDARQGDLTSKQMSALIRQNLSRQERLKVVLLDSFPKDL
jgi:hypothetical protein